MTVANAKVDFWLQGDPRECMIIGPHPEGVKIRTLTMDQSSEPPVVPARWLSEVNVGEFPWIYDVDPSHNEDPWRLTNNQRAVLAALASKDAVGMTDDEHEAINGLRADSAGKRRLELQHKGFVDTVGARRQTRRGSSALIWTITRAGREALTRHDTAHIAS